MANYPTEPQAPRSSAAAQQIPTAKQSVPYPTHADVVGKIGAYACEKYQGTYEVKDDGPVQTIPLPFDPAYVKVLNPANNVSFEALAALDANIIESLSAGAVQRSTAIGLVTLGTKSATVNFDSPLAAAPGDVMLIIAEGYPVNGGLKIITD